MKKKTRTLFSVASIISYVSAGLLALISFLLLFEEQSIIDIFHQVYYSVIENPTPAGFEQMLVSFALFTAFAAYMSYSAGKLYKIFSKAPEKAIVPALNTLSFVSIFQFVYGLLLVPPITLIAPTLAIVAWVQCKQLSTKRVKVAIPAIVLNNSQQAVTVHPQAVQLMIAKITELKQKKEKGVYTEEQYNSKLSKILGGEFDS